MYVPKWLQAWSVYISLCILTQKSVSKSSNLTCPWFPWNYAFLCAHLEKVPNTLRRSVPRCCDQYCSCLCLLVALLGRQALLRLLLRQACERRRILRSPWSAFTLYAATKRDDNVRPAWSGRTGSSVQYQDGEQNRGWIIFSHHLWNL